MEQTSRFSVGMLYKPDALNIMSKKSQEKFYSATSKYDLYNSKWLQIMPKYFC